MAKGNRELGIEITAEDDASKKIEKVADAIAELDDTTEVKVDADTKSALSRVEKFEAELDELELDSTRELRIEFRSQRLQREIRRALSDLEKLEDPVEIEARTADLERAEAELEDVRRLAREKYDVDIDVDTRQIAEATEELEELDSTADELADNIGGIGGDILGLARNAGPAGALVGTLAAAVTETARIGEEVGIISTVLQTSTEEASRLRAVFEDAGIEANDLQDIGLQIAGALEGSPELAERLDLSLREAQNPAEALKAAIENWDFLSATERSQLFGEEGVRQIGRLVARGEDLDDLLAGVEDSRILSEEEIENAQELQRIFAEIKGEIEGLVLEVGGPLAGALADVNDLIEKIPGTGGFADALGRGLSIVTGGFATFVQDEYGGAGEEAGNAFVDGLVGEVLAGADQIAAAAARSRELNDAARGSAGAYDELAASTERAAFWGDRVRAENERQAEAADRAAEAADRAAQAAERQARSLSGLIDVAVQSESANQKLSEAIAKVSEKQASGTVDAEYLQLQRDVAVAADAQAEAAVRQAEQLANLEGRTLTAAESAAIYRGSLAETASQSDVAREAIERYLEQIGLTPAEIETLLTVDDGGSIRDTADELDDVAEDERVADILADSDTAQAAEDLLDFIAETRIAPILARALTLTADFELDQVAATRTAIIFARALTSEANRALNFAARNRTARIFTSTVGGRSSTLSAFTESGAPRSLAAPVDPGVVPFGPSERRFETDFEPVVVDRRDGPASSSLVVNVSTTADMRQVDAAIRRWQRINGTGRR